MPVIGNEVTETESSSYFSIYCHAVGDRYQEWLEKNKVQHARSNSDDEVQQMQNRHKRFG